MVNGLECRLQNSQVISNQPEACRFRNFFLGPIPELFSASVSSHFLEMRRTTCGTKSGMGPRKKFLNLEAWLGGSGPSFGPDLIFKSGQKHQKWFEMGPESTVWPETWSRSMPGPFRSLWGGSNPLQGAVPGQKSQKVCPKTARRIVGRGET